MNRKEILEKALIKAKNNGSRIARQYLVRMRDNPNADWSPRIVLMCCCFDHDFAKAFWGEEPFDGFKEIRTQSGAVSTFKPLYPFCENPEAAKKQDASWKMHLQQMVLLKEPILYLAEFLDE